MSRRSPVNFVGGIYNSTPPVLTDQQFTCVQLDLNGNMLVNVAAGGTGGNASVSLVGQPVPTSATAIGWDDGSGNLQFVSAANPLPISGTISATNPSVGTIGSTAPTSATFLGILNGSGNLEGVGASNPVRVDPTGTTIQPVEVSDGSNVVFTSAHPAYVQGTVVLGAGSALIGKVEAWDGSAILFTSGNPGNVQFQSAQHVIVDSGGGGGTQYTDDTAETAGAFIGTVAMAYDGTDVWGLRMDASKNLNVNLKTAVPAGTNLMGSVTSIGGGTASAGAASWTSGTSLNTALALISNSFAYSSATIYLSTNGSLTGGAAITIEGSFDNFSTTTQALPYIAVNGGATLSGIFSTFPGSITASLQVNTSGFPYVRIRLSTVIGGSNTLTISYSLQESNSSPSVFVASLPTNTTVNLAQINSQSITATTGLLFAKITDGANPMGTMAAFGTSPGTPIALNANVSLFQGATLVSSSAPLNVSPPNDGTNTATVKAASTASVASDKALITQLNPLSQGRVVGKAIDSTGVQRSIIQLPFSKSSSGTTTLVTAFGSTVIYVLSWWVSCGGAANNVNLQSHATTGNTSGVVNMAANGGAVFPENMGTWISGTAGEALDITLSASQQINGAITYCQF